jgi:hypothetical protein
MLEPGGDVQPLVQALLRVGLGGRQLGPADRELHAGPFVRNLLDRWEENGAKIRQKLKRLALKPAMPFPGFKSLSPLRGGGSTALHTNL